jgi:hypothetical protein
LSTGPRPRTPTVAAGMGVGGVDVFQNVASQASHVECEDGMSLVAGVIRISLVSGSPSRK